MRAELEGGAAEQTPLIQRLCRHLSEWSPQPMVAVEGATHVVSVWSTRPSPASWGERRTISSAVPSPRPCRRGTGTVSSRLLDRVFRTGVPENLAEREHRHAQPGPVYWSYTVWAILGEDEQPAGVMIQVTDVTETAVFRRQVTAMNEATLISATRQHELAAAESLARLQGAVQGATTFSPS